MLSGVGVGDAQGGKIRAAAAVRCFLVPAGCQLIDKRPLMVGKKTTLNNWFLSFRVHSVGG